MRSPRRRGTPDWIRTGDLQSRSLSLYPTELRAHIKFVSPAYYNKPKPKSKEIHADSGQYKTVSLLCCGETVLLYYLLCFPRSELNVVRGQKLEAL